jgi:pimeloyl-ACP methyl ester carboxylesterase
MRNGADPTVSEPGFPESTRVSIDGAELEVFEAGQENTGNPIVLCHGWPEHAFSWRHQMPVLAAAGYHVIVPNQRGYGKSSRPNDVAAYDIEHLTADLVGLLDHFGYDSAIFVGHDWGAMVVTWLTLLHPDRVSAVGTLSVPYQVRGDKPWIEWMEEVFGADYYFVHFNRQPGVADALLDANVRRFLRNMFRRNIPHTEPQPGMAMIHLALAESAPGEEVLSEGELDVYVSSFQETGFTGSINWYRNLDRNWRLLADADPIIRQPALMVYGDRDVIPRFEGLRRFVPNVEEVTLSCGHWIQQELPDETNSPINPTCLW